MKTVWLLVFCFSLLADEFPFSADSKCASLIASPLGDRIVVWEEREQILVSEMPIGGNWSMPFVLSRALISASSPQIEMGPSGKAVATWLENGERKSAVKPLKGEWIRLGSEIPPLEDFFADGGDPPLWGGVASSSPQGTDSSSRRALNGQTFASDWPFEEEKPHLQKGKKPPLIRRTLQPLANAIDAPTSSVLSGGQIGFATGTAAPSNGLLVSGQVAIGTSAAGSNTKVTLLSTSTDKYSFLAFGTLNGDDNIQTVGLYLDYTLSPTNNNKSVCGLLNTTSATPVSTNTITEADAAVFSLGGTLGSGTVTAGYSGKFLAPTIGTSRTSLYSDDIAIGYLNVTPPTNGLIVSGQVGIGSSDPGTAGVLASSALSSSAAGASLYGVIIHPTETFNSGSTLSIATGLFLESTTVINTGASVFAQYGLFINPLGNSGAGGGPTNAIGAVVFAPTIGTSSNTALYADNLGIGYSNITPPTNGLIISGQAFFKSASAFINASVEIQGADRITFGIGGTKTSTDGSVQAGQYWGPTYAPTSSTALVTNVLSFPTFSPPTGVTITTAAHVYLQTGGQGGAGSVTTGYNLLIDTPGFGSTSYAASIQGGMVHKWNGRVGNYTIVTNDYFVALTGTGTPTTFFLPTTVPVAGWVVIIKDEGGGALLNNLTVNGNGHNIDNSATLAISTNYGVLRIYSNGTQYYTW